MNELYDNSWQQKRPSLRSGKEVHERFRLEYIPRWGHELKVISRKKLHSARRKTAHRGMNNAWTPDSRTILCVVNRVADLEINAIYYIGM